MPGILDISNELLFEICSYLRPHPLLNITGRPFHCWTSALKEHDSASFAKLQALNSLVRSCRHIHTVLVGELYDYVPLLTSYRGLERFMRTVTENEELGAYVRYASINLSRGDTIADFYSLFWLPNLAVLDVKEYCAWQPGEWEGGSPVGTSPIQTLRLLDCGAHEKALAELLGFPRALEELWYEADQGEWEGYVEGEPVVEFTCEAVRRCMAVHTESLAKLVFSRPVQCHEGLGYVDDGIDLEDFEHLRSLSINQVFLVGLISNTRVSRCLPPNLEELEVFYDDSGFVDFLEEGRIEHPHWLLTLLQELRGPNSKLKHLKRIRIVALEWDPAIGYRWEEPDSDNVSGVSPGDSQGSSDVQLRGHPSSTWRPPKLLLDLLVEAGMCFSIFLHPERRARLTPDHVKGFADTWEDHWDPGY
ncbi:hypothetical protein PGQ11_006359 [Apiospora arundinis]|uniref:F-box domain-containing protein n=1 Tax=Apiospora arundinis TaxID=335852 RepID=A0ABR2IT81_9PEZI